MKKQSLEQGSKEWHKFRRKHIGSSDASYIMGSPFKTPYKLWREKLELDTEIYTSEAMQRGIHLEPIARDKICEILGVELMPAVAEHDKINWIAASFDAISSDNKIIVEIKCPTFQKPKIIPDYYFAQLQHQLYVADLDKMYYFNYFEEDNFLLEVERDQKFIDKMLKMEKNFWECVQTLTPPQSSVIEKTDLKWEALTSEYKNIYFELKELEKKEKEIRKYLIEMSDNQSCKGNGVSLTKIVGKGRIKYEEVPIPKEIDLEQYRGPVVESWRIGVN